jgi:hypothetical protein
VSKRRSVGFREVQPVGFDGAISTSHMNSNVGMLQFGQSRCQRIAGSLKELRALRIQPDDILKGLERVLENRFQSIQVVAISMWTVTASSRCFAKLLTDRRSTHDTTCRSETSPSVN